jgi:hypothetical protein
MNDLPRLFETRPSKIANKLGRQDLRPQAVLAAEAAQA